MDRPVILLDFISLEKKWLHCPSGKDEKADEGGLGMVVANRVMT